MLLQNDTAPRAHQRHVQVLGLLASLPQVENLPIQSQWIHNFCSVSYNSL